MKLKCVAIILIVLIGGVGGYGSYLNQSNLVMEDEAKSNISNYKQDLQWRVESVLDLDNVVKSYLYLYSEANPQVEVELEYIIGDVSSLEAYPQRYPQDGMIPISSWYGGAGVEVVLREIDSNTIAVMAKGIGDGISYSSDWAEYEKWYEIKIKYNSAGAIEALELIHL